MWLSVMRRGQGEYFFLDSPPLLAVRPAFGTQLYPNSLSLLLRRIESQLLWRYVHIYLRLVSYGLLYVEVS